MDFPFWDSYADRKARNTPIMGLSKTERLRRREKNGKPLFAYDILASIFTDTPESFSEFCSEFGYSTDSISARETFIRCGELTAKLKAFFTKQELEELNDIQ